MPKVSKDTATGGGEFGPVTDRSAQVNGYTVNFTSFAEDVDATPLMKGLPDDRCQCPHWGYILSGRMTFRYADGEEVLEAGDAFYTPPGHVPSVEAGTEIVQFSPSEELQKTEEAGHGEEHAGDAGRRLTVDNRAASAFARRRSQARSRTRSTMRGWWRETNRARSTRDAGVRRPDVASVVRARSV